MHVLAADRAQRVSAAFTGKCAVRRQQHGCAVVDGRGVRSSDRPVLLEGRSELRQPGEVDLSGTFIRAYLGHLATPARDADGYDLVSERSVRGSCLGAFVGADRELVLLFAAERVLAGAQFRA